MANQAAWDSGVAIAQKSIADRRQRRQALSDEERKLQVTDLYSKGHELAKLIPSLSGADREKAMGQLTDVESSIHSIYHPDNNPGAIQKDWHLLTNLITRKPRPIPINIGYDSPVTPDLTLPADTQAAQPAAVPATQLRVPGEAITLPGGRSADVRPAPQIMTPTQRRIMALRDEARKRAGLDVGAAGLGPEQEQQAKQRLDEDHLAWQIDWAKRHGVTGEALSELTEHLAGLPTRSKMKPLAGSKPYRGADGRYYQSMQNPDTGEITAQAMPEGYVPPPSSGSDFWRATTAKYGANPTAAQIEGERQRWMAAGAHGTETTTVVDAAGNSRAIRVPTFAPGQTVPEGLTLPPDATVSGDLATPQDWAKDYQPPAGIPTPLTSVRPSQQAGAAPADTSPEEAPIATPFTPTPVSPADSSRLESLGLTPPDGSFIAPPTDPTDAQAALAEADRLGIGNDLRAVANYRLDPNKAPSGRGGGQKKFMDLVLRVNPAYDATKWEAVQLARKSFTAGGLDAKVMNSLGLSVNHLNKLVDTYSALGNGDYPDVNAVRNATRVHIGYGGVAAVDSAANAVSGEMASTFKGSGAAGTDPEIESWRKQFDANMSPDAFNQSVETMTDLMASRLLGEAQLYVNTYGSLKGFPLLAPRTVKVLKGFPDNEGAKLMLEVNREAGGKDVPDDQPTTAAKPLAAKPHAKQPATVKMKAPDGTVQPVPFDQVEHYKSQGAVVVTQ